MLIVDHREKQLSAAMEGIIQFEIQSLPLGDVICKYDDGSTWICERKTSQDLANFFYIMYYYSHLVFCLLVFFY